MNTEVYGLSFCSHSGTACTKLKINASFFSKFVSELGFVLVHSPPSHCSHGHLTAVCLYFRDIGHSMCHGERSIGHSTKIVF